MPGGTQAFHQLILKRRSPFHDPAFNLLVSVIEEEVNEQVKGNHGEHDQREPWMEQEHGGKGKNQDQDVDHDSNGSIVDKSPDLDRIIDSGEDFPGLHTVKEALRKAKQVAVVGCDQLVINHLSGFEHEYIFHS